MNIYLKKRTKSPGDVDDVSWAFFPSPISLHCPSSSRTLPVVVVGTMWLVGGRPVVLLVLVLVLVLVLLPVLLLVQVLVLRLVVENQ